MRPLRIWLPAVRAGSGADVFTMRLARLLESGGMNAGITWLPHWAELAPWLAHAEPPFHPDIVHANSWNAFAFAGLSPLAVTVHHCVHDPSYRPHKSLAQALYHRTWIRRMEQRSLQVADRIIAVSESTRRGVASTFGGVRAETIHCWIDPEIFRPAAPAERHEPFRLLFVGNWDRRKGADLLPELMRQLGPRFELRYRGGLRNRSQRVDLPPNMTHVAPVADEQGMAALYQQCDALIVPSRLEGFGYAALEAMACGRPVVAFANSSLTEVIEHGVTGLLVPQDDVAALAGACRRLEGDVPAWRHMGEAGRARAVEVFGPQRALARHRALYEALMSDTVGNR